MENSKQQKIYEEFINMCIKIEEGKDYKSIINSSSDKEFAKVVIFMLEQKEKENELEGIDKERVHYNYVRASAYVDSYINGDMLSYKKFIVEYDQYGKLLGRYFDSESENKNAVKSILLAKANSLQNKYSSLISVNMILPNF